MKKETNSDRIQLLINWHWNFAGFLKVPRGTAMNIFHKIQKYPCFKEIFSTRLLFLLNKTKHQTHLNKYNQSHTHNFNALPIIVIQKLVAEGKTHVHWASTWIKSILSHIQIEILQFLQKAEKWQEFHKNDRRVP